MSDQKETKKSFFNLKNVSEDAVKKGIFLILAVVFSVLAANGRIASFIEETFVEKQRAEVIKELERKENSSENLFLTLSSVKAILAVVEGSTIGAQIGVIFTGKADIQFGDIIQPLYDYVDIAWKISFASMSSIKIQKFLVGFFKPGNTGILDSLFNVMLSYAVMLLFLSFVYKMSVIIRLRNAAIAGSVLFATLFFLVPSVVVTTNSTIAAMEKFSSGNIEQKLTDISSEIEKKFDMLQKYMAEKEIKKSVEELGSILSDLPGLTAEWIRKITSNVIFYLIQNIFLPLLILWLLFVIFKGLVQQLMMNNPSPQPVENKTNSAISHVIVAFMLFIPVFMQ